MTPLAILLGELALVVVPLAALAYYFRIYPHPPLVLLAAVPAALTPLILIWDQALWLVLAADVAVAILAGIELLTLPSRRHLAVERKVGRIASLRAPHPVAITISHQGHSRRLLWIRDGLPAELEAQPAEFTLQLEPQSRTTVDYALTARRRGAFALRTVHVRARSQWGLWQRLFDYPAEDSLAVYPDMKQLAKYAILARRNRLDLMGLRSSRKLGQDNEFERLRDYALDDNYKHIDWRTSARRGRLTVKDFQRNQSQRLVFLVDCGRMMTNEAAGLSMLDHALNASLMLSYVALSHGDAVGLLCFSDEVHGYQPPRGGMRQMNRLLHASFDRFPRLVESRYDLAFMYLAQHCRKRTLVVLISNLIDEVNAHQIRDHLRSAAGRHLTLAVLLRDRQLFHEADAPHPQEGQLFRTAAAAEMLTWRRQVIRQMTNQGALALDVFPEDLAAPLVNRYLDIKTRQLL